MTPASCFEEELVRALQFDATVVEPGFGFWRGFFMAGVLGGGAGTARCRGRFFEAVTPL
jgi:hypothetical protein